jgi:nucleoside phosphorylase
MGLHYIVITYLAEYGTNNTALIAITLYIKRNFKIRSCLLVGISGGIPSARYNIRLTDMVMGKYIIQYDLGEEIKDKGFDIKINHYAIGKRLSLIWPISK